MDCTRRALNEKEAAQYLHISPITLRESRCYGPRKHKFPPPPFVRLGRSIRYLRDDLDKWLEAHRIVLQSGDDA